MENFEETISQWMRKEVDSKNPAIYEWVWADRSPRKTNINLRTLRKEQLNYYKKVTKEYNDEVSRQEPIPSEVS